MTSDDDELAGDEQEWRSLCGLIDDDPELWPFVRDALANGDDGWEALIGALDDGGALAYLDVGDSGMEVADALGGVRRVVEAQPDLRAANDLDDLREALAAADEALAASGLRLVELEDADEDAVPIIVVAAANVEALIELAGSLGHVASRVGEDDD